MCERGPDEELVVWVVEEGGVGGGVLVTTPPLPPPPPPKWLLGCPLITPPGDPGFKGPPQPY